MGIAGVAMREPLQGRPGLSREDLDRLLALLDPLRERAGERYEAIRARLLRFFSSRKSPGAEELADETIDRVCHKLGQGEVIRSPDLGRYFLGVARNVAREAWDLEQKRRAGGLPSEPTPSTQAGEAGAEEAALACLDRCLQLLPPESRDLVLRYYDNLPGERKAAVRRDLGRRLGLAPNALRIRMHRLRAQLEVCINRCLQTRAETISLAGPLQGGTQGGTGGGGARE